MNPCTSIDVHVCPWCSDGNRSVADGSVACRRRPGGTTLDDAYSGTRTGFSVPSIAPFKARLQAAQQPFVAEGASRLLVSAPSGQLFELFEAGEADGGGDGFDAAAAHAALRGSRCAAGLRDVAC